MIFNLLAAIFMRTYELPTDFNFANYYGMVHDRVVVQTMDIDVTSWIVFLLVLFTNMLLQNTRESEPATQTNETEQHRLLGGGGPAAPPKLFESLVVIQFAVLGWVQVVALLLTLLWVRRILKKVRWWSHMLPSQASGICRSYL